MGINKEKYVLKIASATKKELVIIHFDIIIDYLKESKNYAKKNDKKLDFNVRKARQFLAELKCSLDDEYEISAYLLTMYGYVDKIICQYLFNKNTEILDEAIDILENIKSGFEKIEEDDKDSIMKNAHSVYAGLTYDKNGNLNEYVDGNSNRGFKA